MANYDDDEYGLKGCLVDGLGGCLIDLIMSGIGCIVPTLVVAVFMIWGAKASAQPLKRMVTNLATRFQRARPRLTKRILFNSTHLVHVNDGELRQM
jgi:hypothetical protein